jgi:hypothetical protein
MQGDAPLRKWNDAPRKQAVLMHPVIFIAAFTSLGMLFAAQEWHHAHRSGLDIGAALIFESWGLQYFYWGVINWVLWRLFRPFIQNASAARVLAIVVPLSFVIYLFETMMWVPFFRAYPMNHAPMPYWWRVNHNYWGDITESMAIFWGTFFFFRGMGYYQQLREKETVAAQLEVQLANAKIAALRMQLNPHFLFNTMNSISSLMRGDPDAADSMLEQLSSLLRMTLERRDVQLIPLHEEIEFTETYLAMQDRRYMGRVTRTLSVDPELYDALIPAMILQPIIENAYVHGLSKLDRGGELSIEVRKDGQQVHAQITNNGPGLKSRPVGQSNGYGVGLANVTNRLRLHYGEDCTFSIREVDGTSVQVSIAFPIQLSTTSAESLTRFGA